MNTDRELLGKLKDAAVLVHRYYYETNMPIENVCEIVKLLANNYADNTEELPAVEQTVKKIKRNRYNMKRITYAWCQIDDWVRESDRRGRI